MKLSLNYLLFLVLIVIGQASYGQRKVSIKVQLPSGIDYSKLILKYNNGQYIKEVKPIIANNAFAISDSCYSRYAILIFFYPDSTETEGMSGVAIWVSGKPANISFYQDSLTNKNPFRNYNLVNALSSGDVGEDRYYKFIDTELKDAQNFYFKNRDSINTNEKYLDILRKKQEIGERKGLEFIALNANQYYSIWVFKNEIVPSSSLRADSLLRFYQQVFPDSLKQTYEGNEIIKRLKGRISTKKGGEAPDFRVKDIKGNVVSLNGLRGKYVLLDFWASWCVPCMEAMPQIKSLHQKYPKDQLEIISITVDKTYGNFSAALKKINADWTQIYQGSDLVTRYGVGLIPQVFLINEKGVMAFNMEEEKDYQFIKLKKILEEAFENNNYKPY